MKTKFVVDTTQVKSETVSNALKRNRSYPDSVIWVASEKEPDKKLFGIVMDAKFYESQNSELGEKPIRKILEDQELRQEKHGVPVYGLLVVSQATNHSKVYDDLKLDGKCPKLDLLKLREGEIYVDILAAV